MLFHHLKIAIRNLWNHRFFTVLNLSGLAVGIAVSLALMLFVREEVSFDKYHSNAERVYRLNLEVPDDAGLERWATAPNIAGPTFKEELAEVEDAVRFMRYSFGQTAFLNVGDQNFTDENMYWVDSTVFDVFDIQLLKGDPSTALNGPKKMLLSESTARKFFGEADPMGQIVKLGNRTEMEVTGVYPDFPSNSTLDCGVMGSFVTMTWAIKNLAWSNCSFETYLLLHPEADPAHVEKRIAEVFDKHEKREDQWFSFFLQPFLDIHLHSAGIGQGYSARLGDVKQVKLLGILALAVMLLACFNYVNMTTARSQQRFREVGINKTLGASGGQMVRRFYVETGLLVAVALAIGVLLVEVGLPMFELLSGKDLSVMDLLNSQWAWALPAVWALVTFGAGSYPAFFLSKFSPKNLLSPENQGVTGNQFFRKTLVVGQFAVCTVLIIGALVLQRQLEFISSKKLGFEPEQVVVVSTAGADDRSQVQAFLDASRRLPKVKNACLARAYPGEETSGYSMNKPGQEDKRTSVQANWVTEGFDEVLGVKFLAGRPLPPKAPEDTTVQVVMNEAGVEFLGWTPEEAIGKELPNLFQGRPTTIVGVVEDFHFESMHSSITPYVFTNGNDMAWRPFVLVKLQTEDLFGTMDDLKATFAEHVPASAFDYVFVDDKLDKLYHGEKRLASVVFIFTLLTIFISCLGLFGLAAFTAERRTKEIGIRKVLGATVTGLVGLLAKDFLKPVLLSILIAAPISWLTMNYWLKNFAYRIDMEWWYLALAGALALLVAFATVSMQSLKAALANPVESLRSE